MAITIPDLPASSEERCKKSAALAKYQLELARELCEEVFHKSGDDDLAVKIAAVIATNYHARTTATK